MVLKLKGLICTYNTNFSGSFQNIKIRLIQKATRNLYFKYRHTLFYHTSFYWALQRMYFSHIGSLWQLCIRQIDWCHFPNSMCSFCVALLMYFNFFIMTTSITLICDQWSLMFPLWLCPGVGNSIHKDGKLNQQICVFWLLH